MKRRTIAGAAIITVAAIAARRLGPRREPLARTPVVRAPAHSRAGGDRPSLTLALLAFAWLSAMFRIPGPWDEIVDGVKGVVQAVKDWVVDLLTSVFDFLWGWAVDIYAWIIGGFTDVWKYARELSDWSVRVVNNTVDLVNRKFREATDFAGWIVAELRNEMWSLISRAAGTVIDLVSFGNRIIQDAYNLVAEKIYWPLWHLIDDLRRWVETAFLDRIVAFVSSMVGNVVGELRALPGQVAEIWRWINEVARDAVAIVLKAKGFLLFVITHPFTWWLDYLNRIVESAPEYLFRGVANAAERNVNAMEDWVVKAIGS